VQLGDARLQSNLDRITIVWQVQTTHTPNLDTFRARIRIHPNGTWTPAAAISEISSNPLIAINRANYEADFPDLEWSTSYEYEIAQYDSNRNPIGNWSAIFRSRNNRADDSSFEFVGYGDSAQAPLDAFVSVLQRIEQSNARFTLLFGDNVYESGAHTPHSTQRTVCSRCADAALALALR
jgi:hypothetical protein